MDLLEKSHTSKGKVTFVTIYWLARKCEEVFGDYFNFGDEDGYGDSLYRLFELPEIAKDYGSFQDIKALVTQDEYFAGYLVLSTLCARGHIPPGEYMIVRL